ncbi:MAG: hypothetical protein ACYCZ6_18365 [Polaromonas sp.]
MKKAQRAYAANRDPALVQPPAFCNSSMSAHYKPTPWLSARAGADDNQRYHSVGNLPQITKVES